jgi:hypothetical protein
MTREGLPTIRLRTFDQDDNVTGEIILDPDEARNAAANLELAVENLGMLIDPTGGVWHGGVTRIGSIEIAWTESGDFDQFDDPSLPG